MDDAISREEIFFTDAQLAKRWGCSKMHLWRLRQRGKLSKPIKLGGDGRNLTPGSVVKVIEGGADAST
jgi:hypothetical protein